VKLVWYARLNNGELLAYVIKLKSNVNKCNFEQVKVKVEVEMMQNMFHRSRNQ